MTSEWDEELAPELADRLRRLAGGGAPGRGLEERLVGALRAEGRLAAPRAAVHGRALALHAVAAAAAFALGAGLGPRLRGASAPEPALPRYALFLYQTRASLADSADGRERVAEYKAWARSLAQRGRLVAGEKLQERGALLTAGATEQRVPEAPEGVISGYFVIQAQSLAEALELARSCPHLRHGGRVALRPIDPV
jgi:hypothetical protein